MFYKKRDLCQEKSSKNSTVAKNARTTGAVKPSGIEVSIIKRMFAASSALLTRPAGVLPRKSPQKLQKRAKSYNFLSINIFTEKMEPTSRFELPT